MQMDDRKPNLDTTDPPTDNMVRKIRFPRFTIVEYLVFLAIIGVIYGFFLPPIRRSREPSRRDRCSSNLQAIGKALLDYEKKYKRLPPAYTVDNAGNRLHSWRTLILPFLGEKKLYSQIDLQKPWNDPVNAIPRNSNVPIYCCMNAQSILAENQTNYLTIIAPNSAMRELTGSALSEIRDTRSKTVLVIEANINDGVEWIAPYDLATESLLSELDSNTKSSPHNGRFILMADASTRYLMDPVAQELLEALISIDGGETVELQKTRFDK